MTLTANVKGYINSEEWGVIESQQQKPEYEDFCQDYNYINSINLVESDSGQDNIYYPSPNENADILAQQICDGGFSSHYLYSDISGAVQEYLGGDASTVEILGISNGEFNINFDSTKNYKIIIDTKYKYNNYPIDRFALIHLETTDTVDDYYVTDLIEVAYDNINENLFNNNFTLQSNIINAIIMIVGFN